MPKYNDTSDRKFDTWEWSDRIVAPKDLTFEVRLERPTNVAAGPVRYYIACNNPPISVEANDLGLLRDRLDAAVRAFYAVEWVRVLVISPDVYQHADGITVELKVHEYEQGTLDGKPVYRQRRSEDHRVGANEYAYRMTEGDIEREFKRWHDSPPQPRYVLLDTPENRDLIASIVGTLQAHMTKAAVELAEKEISS